MTWRLSNGIYAMLLIFVLNKSFNTLALAVDYDTNYKDVYSSSNDEFDTPVNDEYENVDMISEKEAVEYKIDNELQPMFNLTELLKKPILPGVRDEKWPHSFINNITRNECEHCECGIPIPNRIVGGKKTQISDYPWMVMLTYRGRFICGGSLLNDRFVLTAAHCTQGLNVRDLDCRFAESVTNEPWTSRAIYRRVESFVRSNKYNEQSMDSDISIIKLKQKLTFSNKIRPVCLPSQGRIIQNINAVVTGWGTIYSDGPSSAYLRKVEVPVLTESQCRKTAYKNEITRNMICAGKTGKDACQGDSGGPLVIYDNELNKHVQIGVVSWGSGCDFKNQPGVYTKVPNFVQWIQDNSNTKCNCNN